MMPRPTHVLPHLHRWMIALTWLLCLVPVTRPVLAQVPALTVDQARARDEAIEIFNQGKAAYKAGDYDAAQQLFLKAWGKYDREPLIALALAKAYDRAANLDKAQIYYEAFLRLAPTDKEFAKDREATVKRLAEVRASLASRPGVLKFQGMPTGARLSIDEKPADPDTNGEVKVTAGTHVVRVAMDQRLPFERPAVTVGPGETKVIDVVLVAPVDPSTLPHDYTLTWILGSASAAALLTGGVFGILTLERNDAYSKRFDLNSGGYAYDATLKDYGCTVGQPGGCPGAIAEGQTYVSQIEFRRNAMLISLGVGAALGAGTVIAALNAPVMDRSGSVQTSAWWQRVRAWPTLDGRGGGGAVVSMAF